MHHSGCLEGTPCSNGRYCGNDNACTSCTFEDCKKLAEKTNAAAFSYRGTASKYCKLCDPSHLQDLRSYKDWGLYRKQSKSHKMNNFHLIILY